MARQPKKQNQEERVLRCKYAGDENDECCVACNGVTMVVEEGEPEISCVNCGGYEPSEEEVVEQAVEEEVKEEVKKPEPKVTAAVSPSKPAKPATKQPEKPATKKPAAVSQPVSEPQPEEAPVCNSEIAKNLSHADVLSNNQGIYTRGSITTEIRAESGVTVEKKDRAGQSVWYKIAYAETRQISPFADVEREKQMLFDDVNAVVDGEIAKLQP